MDALDSTTRLEDLNLPSFDFHPLRMSQVRYSIYVNGPWCITFEWNNGIAKRVDLEQYHCGFIMREEFLVDCRKISRAPTHLGVFFAEDVLPHLRRRTIGEIAMLMGVSRQTLHRVMAGQSAVTPDMAVRLEKLCGNGPELWLTMQARHDVWEATARLSAELKKIPTITD